MKKMRKRGRHCPHSDLRPIYGDEVNHVGGWRLQCRTCGRFLDGPVTLAGSRQGEADGENPVWLPGDESERHLLADRIATRNDVFTPDAEIVLDALWEMRR